MICQVCAPEDVDFSLFWEAYHKLQEKFVSPEKFDIQKIIYGAISGMVKSLDDPYTVFFPPDETERFIKDVKGAFEGVGMEIGIRKGQLEVISPLEGTPAQKAGLRAGDKIIKINDTFTTDLTIEQAVNLIRGPKGSYEAWVQAIDKRGALTLPSQRASFEVGLSPLLKIGTIAISYLTIMSTLIVLIVAAAAVIFYGWYKINIWRKRMRTETKEALNVSEEFISKEVKDIEKELE